MTLIFILEKTKSRAWLGNVVELIVGRRFETLYLEATYNKILLSLPQLIKLQPFFFCRIEIDYHLTVQIAVLKSWVYEKAALRNYSFSDKSVA